MTVDADGTVHVTRTVDAEPIMMAMKDFGDFIGRRVNTQAANKLVGGIDPITAINWSKECGHKIGTRAFAQFAVKRIKHDNEYRKFKVGN